MSVLYKPKCCNCYWWVNITVSNLSPVPFQNLDFVALDERLGVVFVIDLRSTAFVVFPQLFEQVVPDLAAGLVVEEFVAQGQVDA